MPLFLRGREKEGKEELWRQKNASSSDSSIQGGNNINLNIYSSALFLLGYLHLLKRRKLNLLSCASYIFYKNVNAVIPMP